MVLIAVIVIAVGALIGSWALSRSANAHEVVPWGLLWWSNTLTNTGVALLLVGPLTWIGTTLSTRIDEAKDQADIATERATIAEQRAENAEKNVQALANSLAEAREILDSQREETSAERARTFAALDGEAWGIPTLFDAMTYAGFIASSGIRVPVITLNENADAPERWYVRFKLDGEFIIAELTDPTGKDIGGTDIKHDGDIGTFLSRIEYLLESESLVNPNTPDEHLSLAALKRLTKFLIDTDSLRQTTPNWHLFRDIIQLDDIRVPDEPETTETWYFTDKNAIPVHAPHHAFTPTWPLYRMTVDKKIEWINKNKLNGVLTPGYALEIAESLDIGRDPW